MNNENMNMSIMNNNINFNPPMKIIKNYSSNYENSYANAVLQAFSSLDCISNWIKKLNDISNLLKNIQESITKELYILFSNLYNGNQVDSTNLISTLEKQVREIYKKVMKKDEYHFLKYFLIMLHLENNCPNNPEFDINSYNNKTIENIKNDNHMYNSFCNFFQQTTNSIISQYFYNIEKYFTSCSKCSQIFYYDHRIILTFDIDKFLSLRNKIYPNKNCSNISLKECFYYYQYLNDCQCPICKDPMSKEKTTLFSSTKVLILRFKRASHNLKCDIDFDFQFNINDMDISNNNVEARRNNYYLKSIVSLYQFRNCSKYFSDVYINDNWYRFCDIYDSAMNINDDKCLKKYEPQMLIYELNEDNNHTNPFYNSLNQENTSIYLTILVNQPIITFKKNNIMDIIRFNSHLNEVQMKVKKKNNNFYNQNNLDNEN